MQLRPAVPLAAEPGPAALPGPAAPPRRTFTPRVPRVSGRMLTAALGAFAVGTTAAVFAAGAPARAATVPTISAPAIANGWGAITIEGTADPGARVQLYEGAWIHWVNAGRGYNGALYEAEQWINEPAPGNLPTFDVADSSGHYEITRVVDSGFAFYVMAGELRSEIAEVATRIVGYDVSITPNGSGSLRVVAQASPGENYIPVELQRQSGSEWIAVAGEGFTANGGAFEGTFTGEPAGVHIYRLYFGGQTENNLLPGYSEADYRVDNSGTAPGTAVDPSNRPTTPPTKAPTKAPSTAPTTPPATKPATPPAKPVVPPAKPVVPPARPVVPPVKPAPVQPAVGSVQFTRINYDAAGKDTRTRKSLNGEWLRLTNRTGKTIDLKGWTVRDAGGHVYRFASTAYLAAGRSVYIHSGSGTNGSPSLHRYWRSGSHVWNNGGDTATLRSDTGRTIDICRWSSKRKATSC